MTNLEAAPPEQDCSAAGDPAEVELITARDVPLGGVRGITVSRTLPAREIPTIGSWCFLDRFGPAPADAMVVLPHPHTALQTVTWPLSGTIRHRDSVGSDVIVRAGELNLMTAGHGVSHSEISLAGPEPLWGLQLWLALPDDALAAAPGFEQHRELPVAEIDGITATVLAGTFAGISSPATTYTPVVGAQLTVRPGRHTVDLDPTFEHGLMLLDGAADVVGLQLTGDGPNRSAQPAPGLPAGPILYLGTGHARVEIESAVGARMIIIGGTPFDSELLMWWNFVGRSHDDIVAARDQWEQHGERFGQVAGHGADRIAAPPMPTTVLKPRRRRRPTEQG